MRERDRDGWVSVGPAARLLGVSPKTLTAWARAGKVNHLRTLGGHRRYHTGYLRELKAELTQAATATIRPRREEGTTL
jgi:excisionase family DNA binding protein